MGNAFICTQIFHDIALNICYQNNFPVKEEIIDINNKNYNNIDNKNNIYEKKLNALKKYFNKDESGIKNNINNSENRKKHLNDKKHINSLNRLSDDKYELMIKRLLEQKNIRRKGPKRRETIRKEEKIKLIINEILSLNLKEIQDKKNNNKNNIIENKENDLLIKNINNLKLRSASISDKISFLPNNNLNSNININNLQHINTINEIINESSGYSGLYKKKTTQTNSPQCKRH